MYVDDINIFAKNEKELETLLRTIRIYSQDIGMEFGIENCAMLIMKSGKREPTEDTELPSQESIRTLGEKENYKYLGILGMDTIKQREMKEKIRKEYLRKLLESNLCNSNIIKGVNSWAVPLVKYSRPFLRWTRDELRQMD